MNFLVLLKQKQKPLSEWSDTENVQGFFLVFLKFSLEQESKSFNKFFSFYFSLLNVGQWESKAFKKSEIFY